MAIWISVDYDLTPKINETYFVYIFHLEKKQKNKAVAIFYEEGWWTPLGIVTHWLDELELPE